ncbi:MAG: helix-turn-helix transcriptional regulator [Ruminococcaceae bacterium]|nr:helix-turn-helix transcriptional regulator [Oscillospiraceae bacterium]
MDNKISLGTRLNNALACRNVKQKELARYLNVPDNTISYFCKDKRTPNVRQIAEIAKRLEVSADYLLGVSDVMTTDTATRELCLTLGLTDIAIEHLRNDQERSVRDAVNFLFWQHEQYKKAKPADDAFEKNTSFLELLSRFCDLKNATQDLMIGLNLDGELTVRLSDISTNSLNEENALKCQMTGLRGFVSTSLIEAVTNDIIYDITQLLRSISVKQVEKIEWEQWRKESK